MIQQGMVLSVEGELATVEIIRESACSSCHNKASCGAGVIAGCSKSERVEVQARNKVGAEVGQKVMLTSDTGKTVGIAFCVFVLPIIVAFICYFVGLHIALNEKTAIVIAAAVFFVSFFALFFGFDRLLSKKINVEITDIIE